MIAQIRVRCEGTTRQAHSSRIVGTFERYWAPNGLGYDQEGYGWDWEAEALTARYHRRVAAQRVSDERGLDRPVTLSDLRDRLAGRGEHARSGTDSAERRSGGETWLVDPTGRAYTAENLDAAQHAAALNGWHETCEMRCEVCGADYRLRAESVRPVLDQLAEHGVAHIALARLAAIVSSKR